MHDACRWKASRQHEERVERSDDALSHDIEVANSEISLQIWDRLYTILDPVRVHGCTLLAMLPRVHCSNTAHSLH